MKKLLLGSAALMLFSISIIIFQFSCKKDASAQRVNAEESSDETTQTCKLKGTYAGTSHSATGATSTLVYAFKANNFAVGTAYLGGPTVTFGGYRHTCDSVFISVHYDDNDSYYLLKGAFSNDRNTISGSFYNQTTPSDYGTFVMNKQ